MLGSQHDALKLKLLLHEMVMRMGGEMAQGLGIGRYTNGTVYVVEHSMGLWNWRIGGCLLYIYKPLIDIKLGIINSLTLASHVTYSRDCATPPSSLSRAPKDDAVNNLTPHLCSIIALCLLHKRDRAVTFV